MLSRPHLIIRPEEQESIENIPTSEFMEVESDMDIGMWEDNTADRQ